MDFERTYKNRNRIAVLAITIFAPTAL